MNKFSFLACVLAAVPLLASCDKENGINGGDGSEASFETSIVIDGNDINMTVLPSDSSAVYVSGLIMEDDYAAMGGADGVVSYVEELVANGEAELRSGNYTGLYGDLFWQTKYYSYVAQIDGSVVVGTPVIEEQYIYRPYVEFASESVAIGPCAVSDNGLWVVGNAYNGDTRNSFIYDVRRDSLTIVEGVSLYDMTDDGAAYGTSGPYPVIYKDGQITEISSVGTFAESGFYGVTPDGSLAVGFTMSDGMKNSAIVYENGAVSEISAVGYKEGKINGAAAKGVGSNGNIVGYIQNEEPWLEIGCAWTGTSHEYSLFAEDLMVWNPDLLDGGGALEKRYGDLEIRISPNGRYYAGYLVVTEEGSWDQPQYVFVHDAQQDKMHELIDGNYAGWRPDAVSSTGLLFLSSTSVGQSSEPFVWDLNTGEVSALAEYASAEYGYAPEEHTIQGSVVAVSEDGKTIVGDYVESTYITYICFIPR